MNQDNDFFLYEIQCIKYHQETYGQQSWHWTEIPHNILYESGFIHEGNEYRLKKIIDKGNKKCINPIQEYGLDGIALEIKNDEKIYHGIQCKLWKNKLCANDLGTFFTCILGRLNNKNKNSKGFLYHSGPLEINLKDDLHQMPNYIYTIQLDYNNIYNKNIFDFTDSDICIYLKNIVGHNFIYKNICDNYKLFYFNGKYWENGDIFLKKYISTDIYDFYKKKLIEFYWNAYDFQNIKKKIEKLKTFAFKKEIVETYKEYGTNNSINFDENWQLFGFNNVVYDLQIGKFREYKYDDYISITCGYDWREPTDNEIKDVNELIDSIMPIKEEKELFLQILCTSLDGHCLEKFVIFNGSGGNGKGVIDDLLLKAVGNYGMIGNNGILFEKSKTGSNPEKNNIHKKRLVIFREPSEKNKFENSIIKELTGGGTFSARTHHEKSTIKELNLTMIVECNKRPLFAEEPQDAETRRIIDIYFRSKFTTDKTIIDNDNHIYLANPYYKTFEFQEKHKFALLKILFEQYEIYKQNNYILNISQSINDRTQLYLEMSCNIVQWFKDNYILTNQKEEYIQVKDIYSKFSQSDYYLNLSRNEKRKYNKSYFLEYFQTNIFFRKFFAERYNNVRSVIKLWKEKINDGLY